MLDTTVTRNELFGVTQNVTKTKIIVLWKNHISITNKPVYKYLGTLINDNCDDNTVSYIIRQSSLHINKEIFRNVRNKLKTSSPYGSMIHSLHVTVQI